MKSLAPTVRALLALPLAAAFLLGSLASAQTVTSAVPGVISYQGKFSNASGVAVGAGTPVNRTVIFRVWSHQSNSTASDLLYSEQQTVAISEGEFSVLIGAGTAVAGLPLGYSEAAKGPPNIGISALSVFGGPARYLGVTVDDGSAAADPELSPRQQIVSSAYALRARYAESLGANGASTIIALDNGNVGIGAANPAVKLEVAGSIRAGGAGITNPSLSLLANSATTVATSIGYANTAGALSSSAAIGDTVFRTDNAGKLHFQSGTSGAALTINAVNNVGIGQPNPGFPLNFASTLGDKISLYGNAGAHFGFGIQGSLLQIHTDLSGSDIAFGYGSSSALTELMRIKGTGNVGIGTTTPGATLDVNGSVRAAGASGFTFSGGDLDGGLFSPADGTVTLLTNATERLRVNSSGNIGIGTTTPGAKLDVNGSVRAAGGSGFTFSGGDADGGLFSPADGIVTLQTNNAERVRIDSSGNVGIGTTTPVAPISLANVLGQKITLWGQTSSSNYGLGIQGGLLQIHSAESASDIAFGYGSSASFGETMRIKGNGTVGIGTNAPSKGKVEIAGWVNSNPAANTAYNRGGTYNQAAGSATSLSLYADLDIGARQFLAFSDARIKRSAGRSDAARDLATLQDIEVTDYTYIDTIAKGARSHKKVIAQQVEKIFPQAVSRSTDEVPDIYQHAAIKDGWVILPTDLKPGERVRLIAGQKAGVFEVLEVAAGKFRTAFAAESDEVFVYGREVQDFRTVDYDALAMLNVSATQELKREVDTLRTANTALTVRLAELEAKDRARDTKLAAIEKLLSSGQTVLARPAAPNANGQE